MTKNNKKNLKRKTLAVLLVIAMTITMFPATAFGLEGPDGFHDPNPANGFEFPSFPGGNDDDKQLGDDDDKQFGDDDDKQLGDDDDKQFGGDDDKQLGDDDDKQFGDDDDRDKDRSRGHIHLQSVPSGVYSKITVYFTDESGMDTAVLDKPKNKGTEWTKNGSSWYTTADKDGYKLVDHIVLVRADGKTEYRTAATANCQDNTGVDLTLGSSTTPLSQAVVKVYLDGKLVETDVDTYSDVDAGDKITLDESDIADYKPKGKDVVFDSENEDNLLSGTPVAGETLILTLNYKTNTSVQPPAEDEDKDGPSVSFYVRFDGRVVDTTGGYSSHSTDLYTSSLKWTGISEDEGYDITKDITSYKGWIVGNTAEEANAIIETLASEENAYKFHIPGFLGSGDDIDALVDWLKDNPRKKIFFNSKNITSDIISSPEEFDIYWYVFKNEYHGYGWTKDNCYHIDGVVVYKPATTAELTVSKTFVADSEDAVKEAAKLFSINITGSDNSEEYIELTTSSTAGGDYNYLKSVKSSVTESEDSYSKTYTWTLELPKGEYNVAEAAEAPEGYTVTLPDNTSQAVSLNNDARALFTNIYAPVEEPPLPPADPKGTLIIEKSFTGDKVEISPDLMFDIVGPADYETSVLYSEFENGRYILSNLELGEYFVSERNSEVEGYTLTVKTNCDSVTLSKEESRGIFSIENEYTLIPVEPEVPVTGTLTILKDFMGDEVTAPEDLSFTIMGPNNYVRTVLYSDFENDAFVVEGLELGTYKVFENNAAVEGYELDARVENDTVYLDKENYESRVYFENEYTLIPVEPEVPVTGTLTIMKDFMGDEVTVPEDLSFTVTGPEDYEITVLYADFDNDAYTLSDLPIGTYTVTENNAQIEGYTLEVRVSAESLMISEETPNAEIAFENDYTVIPGNNPKPTPKPTPKPDPVIDVPEEDVPLADIPEEDVPLADIPEEDVPLTDIPEEDVPLADVPKTNDNIGLWLMLAGLSLIGITLMITNRRRKADDAIE